MNLNDDFLRMLRLALPDEADRLTVALQSAPEVSIRLNPRKKPDALRIPTEHVPWNANGYYLSERPQFTFDPLFHAGCYYVQDASSMFIGHVLRQFSGGSSPLVCLDLCAAPGGKSTTAIDALPEGSLVVCNEIDGQRSRILRENIIKWGSPHVVVTNDDARSLGQLKGFFDIVVADMPCSGEGMFRKDEDAVAQWSPSLVQTCASRQRDIAIAIWPALRPGGIFVYSTCTFNVHENEENVRFICNTLGATPLEVPTCRAWNIHGAIGSDLPCYRFMPYCTRGEGLFVAVMRKTGVPIGHERRADSASKKRLERRPAKHYPAPVEVRSLLRNPEDFEICSADGATFYAFPAIQAANIRKINASTHTLLAGIPLAAIKGKNCIPDHALSQSTAFNTDSYPTVEISYPEAIALLRGETIALPGGLPLGYVCITYRNCPLGFVKNIGNRTNNLYPKEWRIRSTFGPQESPNII